MTPIENRWLRLLLDNLQWLVASLLVAFGFWVLAVLQNDPIQERDFSRFLQAEVLYDDDMTITRDDDLNDILVTIRGPQSVLNSLRSDQINIIADVRGRTAGTHQVTLEGYLDDGIRGEVARISPAFAEITQEQLEERRLPIAVEITQAPPIGYTASPPSCDQNEATARGTTAQLDQIRLVASINLSEDRSSLTLTVPILPLNANNRPISGIRLEPSQIECSIQIQQRENVFELSVVPLIEGFPPSGYIYQGFDYEPKTIVVTGSSSRIRELNGIVQTEPVSLNDETSNFERTVDVILPEGVRLTNEAQQINISVTIGTIPGNLQYTNMPIQVSGLAPGLTPEILPNSVTAFAVGPRPLLRELSPEDIRVVVDVTDLEAGSYQSTVSASIIVEDLQEIEITVQPAEISVNLLPITTGDDPPSPTPSPTPRLDIR